MNTNPQTDDVQPKRKRRWPKRVAILFIVLVLLVVLSPLALSLPPVRNMVASKASDAIGREVSLESASAFWGKGIDLEGVTVASPPGFDEPLARVERVHVDVALLGLLRGEVDASVLVESPRISVLRDAEGRSNLDGLSGTEAEEGETPETEPAPDAEADAEAETASPLRLHLEVKNGVLRAQPGPGVPPEEVTDLQAVVDFSGEGQLSLRFSANARGMAVGGGDAELAVLAGLSSEGSGPIELDVPAIDLSRLSTLASELAGLEEITGTLALKARGEMRPGPGGVGRFEAKAKDLKLRTKDGLSLTIGSIDAITKVTEGDGGSTVDLNVLVGNIGFTDESGPERLHFEEPRLELTLKGRHQPEAEELVVETATLRAGQALAIIASKPWHVKGGDQPEVKGQLDVHADLEKLSRLQALVPALANVKAGKIAGRIQAEAVDGIDVKAAFRAAGVALAPGELSATGYVERQADFYVQATRAAGEGDIPLEILVRQVQSSMLTLGPVKDEPPLTISIAESGVGVRGKAAAALNLEPLGRAFGGALGLTSPEDRLGGTLHLGLDADLDDGQGKATVRLTGRGVALPASWAADVPPAELSGDVRVAMGEDTTRVDVTALQGFGLTITADATLGNDSGTAEGDTSGLRHANIAITGELAGARPLLAGFLGLAPRARLSGTLDAKAQVIEGESERAIKGTLTVNSLVWQDETGATLLDEPRLELRHHLAMETASEDAAYTVREMTLKSRAITAEVEGTAKPGDEGLGLDTRLSIRGDAAQLAGVLKGMLGEDYRDMQGAGAIEGALGLKGSTANGGESLLIDGNIAPGNWSFGGLTLNDASLSLKRGSVAEPLVVLFQAGVNGGRMEVREEVRLQKDALPWTLKLDVKQVDTSPLLVDRGFGQYLGYALPTLLPSGSSGPVLTGMLDVDIRLQAQDVSSPTLTSTLQGQGSIRMTGGSIGQSALFQAIGGGRGLGDVGPILLKAVPEVGSALTSFTRSINFSRVESDFTVGQEIVHVTRGLLEGDRTRIDMKGRVGFDERVDLNVDLVFTAGKAAERLAKVLPSKTIPLRVTNTVSAPRVTPKLNAKDLATGALQGVLPIPGRGGKNPLEGLKDLLPR